MLIWGWTIPLIDRLWRTPWGYSRSVQLEANFFIILTICTAFPTHLSSGMTQMVLTSCVKQGGSGTFMPHQTAEMCDCRGRISLHTDRLVVCTYLIWLVDGVKWDPCCSYQGVPDESFIPYLHNQTQVQTIYLTWATDRDTEIEIRPSTNMMKKCTNSPTHLCEFKTLHQCPLGESLKIALPTLGELRKWA